MSDFESRTQDGFKPQRLATGAPVVGDATVTRADANSLTRVDSAAGVRLFNLPSLATVPIGWTCYLQKLGTGTNTVTATPDGSDTVNGAASDTLTTENAGAMIVAASATDWAMLNVI